MIDLHTHILPGLDDGARDLATAVEMARVSAAEGVRVIVCTSHRRDRWPNEPAQIHAGVAELQPLLEREQIPVRLVAGMEIALDQIADMDDEQLGAATLGTGRWLLLEMPPRGWPLELPELMTALEVRGFRVVIAHPERNESVQAGPDRLRDLVGRGALVQVTADSITGEHGAAPQRSAQALLRSGLVHVIASDMHGAPARRPGVLAGVAAAAKFLRVGADKLAWMVRDVPQAIISGAEVRPPHTTQSG